MLKSHFFVGGWRVTQWVDRDHLARVIAARTLEPEDPLAPARGCTVAVAVMALWCVFAYVVWVIV